METSYYLLQTDNNYVQHLLVTVLSVQKHTPADRKNVFYIINDRIAEETIAFMDTFAKRFSLELRYLDMSDKVSLFEERGIPKWHGGYTAYMKLFAMSKIEDADRVLYLDSDIIVREDLTPVFAELDGTDAPIAMAEDMTISTRLDYKAYVYENDDPTLVYHNVGSILFDVARWKEQRCEERLLAFIQTNERDLMFFEQDAMNLVFFGQVKTFSCKYNFCTPLLYFGAKMMGKLFHWDAERTATYEKLMNEYAVGHLFAVFAHRPWHAGSLQPLTAAYVALYEEIYEKPFVGAPIRLRLADKLQYILYRVFRPAYPILHKFFTDRFYRSFIDAAKAKASQK